MPQKHPVADMDPFMDLKPHDQLPPHADHSVSAKNQDTMTWACTKNFVVLDIQQEAPTDPMKPANPFYRLLPFPATKGTGAGAKYVANSGPANPAAAGQRYKVTVSFEGKPPIDPHFIVDP